MSHEQEVFITYRTERLVAVAMQLTIRNAIGFTYNDVVYQIDDMSQMRITALAVKAQRAIDQAPGATWEQNFHFIAADNTAVPFTAEQFGPFADAASNVVIARRLHARDLKDQLLAAQTIEELDAIDVTAGWPS